jgi:hypothetical protein
VLSSLLLAGCAVPAGPAAPQPYDVAAQATIGARVGADAATTYEAWSGRVTATAYAATRTVEMVTAEAQERATATAGALQALATATAQAQGAAATATSQALAYRATEQAIGIMATREAVGAQATATDVALQARIVAEGAADEATRQAILRRQESARAARAETWNRLWPLLVLAGAVTGLVALAMELADRWRQRRPVQLVTLTPDSIPLVYAGGSLRVLPRQRQLQETRSAALLPPPPETQRADPEPLPPMTSGHVLVAGETGSRKTTALRHVLARRQNVVVLDPHDDGRTWPHSARVVGGGRDFEAIAAFMDEMGQLLGDRYRERAAGRDGFEPVAVDEMPAIVAALGNGANEAWARWLREGRKVRLFFAVATQSTRVKSLGIEGEGDLLANFDYTLILGKLAAEQYGALVAGLDFPAVLRTVAGARPVLLPPLPGQGERRESLAVAPEVPAVDTEWGRVEPGQVAQIVTMTRAGTYSGRAIEEAVFGYMGGNAWRMRKAVVERFCGVDDGAT